MQESFDNVALPLPEAMSEEMRAMLERDIRQRLDVGISPERGRELNEEIETIAAILEEERIPCFLAGGTAIDLLDGTWDRDHLDLDVAISSADRNRLYDAIVDRGFVITDPERKELSREDVCDPSRHNCFFSRIIDGREDKFEVMFLDEVANGDIKINNAVAAPRESYIHAPMATVGDRAVLLQPPEIILFYKLTDGRRKDFRDIEKTWNMLVEEQRGLLEHYLSSSNVRFVIDGRNIAFADLFIEAHKKDAELQERFFHHRLPEIEQKLSADIVLRSGEIFTKRQEISDREDFCTTVIRMYGDDTPKRRKDIEDIANQLYRDPVPTLLEFRTWAKEYIGIEATVRKTAFHEYVSQSLWTVKTEKQE